MSTPICSILQVQSHLLQWRAQELWLVKAHQCGTACIVPLGRVQAEHQSWWAIEVLLLRDTIPHNLLYKFGHHYYKIHHTSPSFPQTIPLKPRFCSPVPN